MPPASKTEHHLISNTAIPYISNSSITSTQPQWITGSQNIMTSLQEWSEKRPGFSAKLERIATQFNNLRSHIVWQRWETSTSNAGDFIWMGCDLASPGTPLVANITAYQTFGLFPHSTVTFQAANSFIAGMQVAIADTSPFNGQILTLTAATPTTFSAQVSAGSSGGLVADTGTATQIIASSVYTMNLRTDASAQLLFTSISSEAFAFVISNNTCYFGNGTDMRKWDSVNLKTWGGTGPVAGPGISLIAGTNNVYTSWCYCYTYFDSADDHETSPSPISACSGVFTNKSVNLALTASTNTRFDQIRVYRTPDGGAQDPTEMQEITGSPFPNATATVNDSTLDVNLSIRVAPQFLRNDPPPPSIPQATWAGRIYTFLDNNVYYSGFEEISNGVPEECFPSGLAGNIYPYATTVKGMAALLDGVAVLSPERISKIEGDSLDTFRRYTLLEKRGTRSRTTVTAMGGSVVWLDTSKTIWLSDIGEIGIPIRPDTKNIDPLNCWIAIHISGLFHWVVVLDGVNGLLYVYDLDRRLWQTPWNVGTTATALFSGETSTGVVDLLMARGGTKVLKLVEGTYNDDGTAYGAVGTTNQFQLTPDENIAAKGILDWTEIKTDPVPPSQVLQLTDDDPGLATFTDISGNKEPSPDIVQGQFLQTWRYTSGEANRVTTPECQFISIQYVWPAIDQNFHLYTIDLSFHPAGG